MPALTGVRNAADAGELVAFLVEREVPARVHLHPRLGYVAMVSPPWGPTHLRSWDDVFNYLQELVSEGAWCERDADAGGD